MKLNRNRGFTLIELMIVVVIIGILAAIAIPNFMKFQAKSRTSEAKANLKGLFTAQKAYAQEKTAYGTAFVGSGTTGTLTPIGYSPERGNRYAYNMGATSWQSRNGVSLPPETNVAYDAIGADSFKYPEIQVVQGTGLVVPTTASVPVFTADAAAAAGSCPTAANFANTTGFSATATGNIDSETIGLDVWFISSCSAVVPPGNCVASDELNVASGTPGRLYNDVDCDT